MREIQSIEEIQQISLRLLNYFDDYCKENGLTYYLAWGTLLGAVRHKGFIPWDDDIDLMMPREDYNRLIATCPEKPCDGVRFYSTKKGGKFVNANFRISDTGSVVDFSLSKNLVEQGIWVTVFPLDHLPDNQNERKKFLQKVKKAYFLVLRSMTKNSMIKGKNFRARVAKVFNAMCPLGVAKMLYRRLDAELQRYKDVDTKEVGILSIGTGDKTHFPKSCFDETQTALFEGREYPVPAGYDEILRNTYGDYMTLPPVEERVPKHNFVAYYRQ